MPLPAPPAIHWSSVDINPARLNPRLRPARLTPSQRRKLLRVLVADKSGFWDGCEPDAEFIRLLRFTVAPLGRPGIIHVSPGPGCNRGGQGANAGEWLIELTGPRPHVLGHLTGWGLGIQPHVSHGLHDFVTGWHNSATSYGLEYMRFNGKVYQPIGHHEVIDCRPLNEQDADESSCYAEGGRPRDSSPHI